jgi:hypothetical protein
MKFIYLFLFMGMIFSGCASKFDQRSYDRQNDAAQKSLDSL